MQVCSTVRVLVTLSLGCLTKLRTVDGGHRAIKYTRFEAPRCDTLSLAYKRVIGCAELEKKFTPKELTSWYFPLWSSSIHPILTRESDSLVRDTHRI